MLDQVRSVLIVWNTEVIGILSRYTSRPAKAHYCDMLGIFCYKLVTMPVQ